MGGSLYLVSRKQDIGTATGQGQIATALLIRLPLSDIFQPVPGYWFIGNCLLAPGGRKRSIADMVQYYFANKLYIQMRRTLLNQALGSFTFKPQHPGARFLLILPFALLMQLSIAQFTITFDVAEPACYGLPIGSVTANVSGGTGPFVFLWSNGQVGPTLNNISAGNYSVTVIDAAGATVSESVSVGQPTLLSVSLSANVCSLPIIITANGSGGSPPYHYSWTTGATGSVITVPGPGAYCVTMTDQNLCGTVGCITVSLNPLNVSVATNGLACPDSGDGEVLAVVTGGTPPYSYLWSNGATTAAQTGLGPGLYSVTVTDLAGCTDSASGAVTAPPPLTSNVTGAGPTCAGNTNGSAVASAGGGTPPYTFLWSTGASSPAITNLAAGTYSVTISDANGCDITDMITLSPVSALTATASASPESCPGANDGTATATAMNGVPPYIYLWSNGGATQTITGLNPGAYTVTVIDGAGCTATAVVFVIAAPPLEISVSATDVTTCDAADGAATVTIINGLAPLSIAWSNGGTTPTITGLAGGAYGVTVTDANGCTETGTAVVNEPPDVSVNVAATPTVCPGEAAGTATAVVSGGTMPFSFIWNTGAVTPMISNLPAGTYTVVVTDANGCQATASATIAESPQLQATVDGAEVVCGAGATGEATVSVSGGVPPYSYEWSTGEITESIQNLPEGAYSVTITDANGCSTVADITIDIVDDFEIVIVPRDILCHGAANGSILVSASGGAPPYAYSWSNGGSANEITNLTPGTYSVTVTDAGGCTQEASATVNEPPALNLSVSGANVSCPGAGDGTASASVSGGVPPYAYAWSNGATTASISNLGPGTYSVTVKDANLCEAGGSVVITEPPQLQGNVSTSDTRCAGEANGTAAASISGGNPPYTYAWSNGASGSAANGLAAGSYSLSITDARGCMLVLNFNIGEPDPVTASLSATDIFCDDNNTGAITATAGGGTPPYSFEWSNGASGATITGLAAGTYTVTVTDQNECEVVRSATVQQFPGLMLTPVATTPDCFGEANGAAAVVVTGGTPPFTYLWNNGSTGAELLNIPAGVYMVTVTDAAGCSGSATVGVAEPSELVAQVVSANITNASCNAFSDGRATITVSGGSIPYTYLWSNGQTAATATNLGAGAYTATITDANGCTDVVNVQITEPPALIVGASAGTGATCENTANGTANASVSGGTPPYSYSWSNGAVTSGIGNLAAGNYTVTVTDANGCTAAASVAINAFDSPSCSVSVLNPVSEGNTDGVLQVLVSGGTSPFSFLWNNGQTSATLTNLGPGNYSVAVTDANGCTTSCSAVLNNPCENITDPGRIGPDQFLCGPGNDPGLIMNLETPSGGVGPIQYLWMMSTQPGPFNVQAWTPIPNSNSPTYDPPVLYETTYFARCVRREGCSVYLEGNIVTVEVGSVANAQINGPGYICVGETATYTAGPTGAGAVISWYVSGPVTPTSGAGPQITLTAHNFGIVNITLQVIENGCTARNIKRVTATNSSLYCGQGRPFPINVEVTGQEEGEVLVSWMMENSLATGHTFTVEHSGDGGQFEAIGVVENPAAYLGSMNYYEFEHRQPKRGRNFYRIIIHTPAGEEFLSEVEEAILFNDSEIALLYPNPTSGQAVIELFEDFGEEVQVDIISANGARLYSRLLAEGTQRAEFNLGGYPPGVYFFALRYSKSGVKVLKVLKH